MNAIKRALLYTTRRKDKSIALGLLLAAVGSAALMSLSAWRETGRAADALAAVSGARLILSGKPLDVARGENGYAARLAPILKADADALATLAGVDAWNAEQTVPVPSDGFAAPSGRSEVLLSANTRTDRNRRFQSGAVVLREGRHITPEDRYAAVVSRATAETNRLKPGDRLALGSAGPELRVVGVYDAGNDPDFDSDQLFMDHAAYRDATGESEETYAGVADFYVGDPESLPQVLENARRLLEERGSDAVLRADPGTWDALAPEIARLRTLTAVIAASIAAAAAIVVCLVVRQRVQGRVREAGILLALGVARREILLQLFVETAVVFAASSLISLPAGQFGSAIVRGLLPGAAPADLGNVFAEEAFVLLGAEFAIVAVATTIASLRAFRGSPRRVLSDAG